jgi:hypothetical protein
MQDDVARSCLVDHSLVAVVGFSAYLSWLLGPEVVMFYL